MFPQASFVRTAFGTVALAILSVTLPPSLFAQDAVIRDGIAKYVEHGDARSAAMILAERIREGGLSRVDEIRGLVTLADAFLALGDTLSATEAIVRVLQHEPCLVPSEEFAPPAWRMLYLRHRPAGVNCSSEWFESTLKSMLLPGWGQYSLGNTRGGVIQFLLTTGAAGYAFARWQASDRHYERYQQTRDPFIARSEYREADRALTQARTAGVISAALWLIGVVETTRAGLERDRYIWRVGQYVPPPVIEPDGAIRISFRLTH